MLASITRGTLLKNSTKYERGKINSLYCTSTYGWKRIFVINQPGQAKCPSAMHDTFSKFFNQVELILVFECSNWYQLMWLHELKPKNCE